MASRGRDINIRYVIDLVDTGVRKALAEDRKIRQSVKQTGSQIEQASKRATSASQKQSQAAQRQATAYRRTATAARQTSVAERAASRVTGLVATGYNRTAASAHRASRSYQEVARSAKQAETAQRKQASAAKSLLGAGAAKVAGVAGAAGAGVGLFAAVRAGVAFEKQMDRVQAVSTATGREMAQLNQLAKQLGAETAFSAGEAADGMYQLATAGFDVNQVMKTIPGTLDLASASATDLASAAALQAAAIRGFGLSAKDAGHVADVLATTVNKSAVEMSDLADTLPYVASTARQTGTSFEQVAAAAGVLGDAGIKGSMAGTALRTSMLRLTDPTVKMKDRLGEMGIEAKDLAAIPLPEVIGRVAEGLKKLPTRGEKVGAISAIFGKEAAPAMLNLMAKGRGEIDKLVEALENSDGAARKSAATMRDNVAGAWDEFTGSVETASITLFEKFGPSLKEGLKGAAGFVNELGAGLTGQRRTRTRTVTDTEGPGNTVSRIKEVLPQTGVEKFAAGVREVVGGVADFIGDKVIPSVVEFGKKLLDAFRPALPFFKNILGPILGGVGKAILDAFKVLGQIVPPVIKVIATGLGAIGTVAKPLKPVFAAVGYVIGTVFGPGILKAVGLVVGVFGRFGNAVGLALGAAGKILSGFYRALGAAFKGIMSVLRPVGRFIGGAFTAVWSRFKGVVSGVLDALKGGFRLFARVLGNVIAAVLRGFANTFELASKLPFVGDKFKGLAAAANAAAGKIDRWGEANDGAKGKARTHADQIQRLREKLDHLPEEKVVQIVFRRHGAPGPQGPLPSGRAGGVFAAGGLVTARVSPGELLVDPSGMTAVVPGARAAADNVTAALRGGTMVFTDHGQSMLAAGASFGQALANQVPHFMAGGQVARLAHSVGARKRKLVESVAISKAESGWNESAENRNSDGSTDRGLWQINSIHGRHSTFDPQKNARGMWAVSNKGSSWGPWVAYNSGAYRTHMPAAQAAVRGMDTTQDVRVPGATRLGFAGRLPSAVGAFQSGFQAGLGGTGLWDADILPDIVSGARATFTKVGGGSLPGRSRRSGGPAATGPARIQAAIAEANRIDAANYSYKYGAGHSNPAPASGPYDCSAVVARIMQKAGFGFPTGTSGTYMGAGAAGKGKNLSVMSTPGHTYMVLNGRAFGTATSTGGGGWVSGSGYPYRPGFVARHPRDTARGVFRKGGRVGGSWGGPRTSAPSSMLGNWRRGDPTDNAELKTVLQQLAGYLDDVGFITYRRLGRMVGNLAQGIRRLKRGDEDRGQRVQIRRLEAAQRVVQTEQGRRTGLALWNVQRRREGLEGRRTAAGQLLRIHGIDEGSSQGIGGMRDVTGNEVTGLVGMRRTLNQALRRATRAGDKTGVREITEQLKGVQGEIAEGVTSWIEQSREVVRAAAAERLEISGFGTGMVTEKLRGFEIGQKLAGTYETGGGERAEFIRTQLIPALNTELADIQQAGVDAIGIGDWAAWRQAMLDYLGKGNEIGDAQLAAIEEGTVKVEEGNEKVAQAVEKVYKDRGGALTLDYRGEGFPLGLLGVGVGA